MSDPLDLQESIHFLEQGRHKVGSLVSEDLFWYSNTGKDSYQLLGNMTGFCSSRATALE